jgi:hypothetical protein
MTILLLTKKLLPIERELIKNILYYLESPADSDSAGLKSWLVAG